MTVTGTQPEHVHGIATRSPIVCNVGAELCSITQLLQVLLAARATALPWRPRLWRRCKLWWARLLRCPADPVRLLRTLAWWLPLGSRVAVIGEPLTVGWLALLLTRAGRQVSIIAPLATAVPEALAAVLHRAGVVYVPAARPLDMGAGVLHVVLHGSVVALPVDSVVDGREPFDVPCSLQALPDVLIPEMVG